MRAGKSWLGKSRVFFLSLSPRLGVEGERMARAHLTPAEETLFASMSRYDRAHSLLVARDLGGVRSLVKAALLHDTGKLRRELPAWFRICYTGAEIFASHHLKRAAESLKERVGQGSSRERLARLERRSDRALFAQTYHGELAAEMLEGLGTELEVVRLVRYHQVIPGSDDEVLIRFIRADSAF